MPSYFFVRYRKHCCLLLRVVLYLSMMERHHYSIQTKVMTILVRWTELTCLFQQHHMLAYISAHNKTYIIPYKTMILLFFFFDLHDINLFVYALKHSQ